MPEVSSLTEPVSILVVLYLVIKELISLLKHRKFDGVTGTRMADLVTKENINTSIAVHLLPLLNRQVEILGELKDIASKNNERMITAEIGLNQLIGGQDKIRTSLHNIGNGVMAITPKEK